MLEGLSKSIDLLEDFSTASAGAANSSSLAADLGAPGPEDPFPGLVEPDNIEAQIIITNYSSFGFLFLL